MRILWINNSIYLNSEGGGSSTHNTFTRRAFASLGHQLLDLSSVQSDVNENLNLSLKRSIYRSLKRIAPKLIMDFVRDIYSIHSDRLFSKIIREKIISEKPDIIYERFSDFHDGAKVAKKFNVPYILEIHATPEERKLYQYPNFNNRYKNIQLKAASAADLIVVVSNYLKNYLISNGISDHKIIVNPNAVDLNIFCAKGKRDFIRDQLGISDKFVVGFLGTMQPFHGIDLLPEVCARVSKEIPKVCFLMVGKISHEKFKSDFSILLDKFKVKNSFYLVGSVPVEVASQYVEAMDIGIMPDSNEYGSPIKLFEYGALAKACLMPSYEPIRDIIKDGVNGFLFKPRSISEMSEKIISLSKNPDLCLKVGKNLYVDIISKHTWLDNAKKIIDNIYVLRPELMDSKFRIEKSLRG